MPGMSKFNAAWKRVCLILLIACAPAAHSGEFDELQGSDDSSAFTAAERALMIDAVGKYKRYEIPIDIIGDALYWVDNERAAFSSRKYGRWEARPDEPSRVIVYHVRTGEITDSGYRGILRCVNHAGDTLIHQMDREGGSYSRPEQYRWFAGKWGKPLQQIDYVKDSFISFYLCENKSYINPPQQLPVISERIIPLLPEHGVLKQTVTLQGDKQQEQLYLIKPTGEEIFLRPEKLSEYFFFYQPWSDTYFETGTTVHTVSTIYPSGKSVTHAIPKLLRFWADKHTASAGAYSCGKGVVWSVHRSGRHWKKQGIYLDSDGKFIRIEAGQATGWIKTSPDGCKILAGIWDGDPSKRSTPRKVVVINVCEEVKQ